MTRADYVRAQRLAPGRRFLWILLVVGLVLALPTSFFAFVFWFVDGKAPVGLVRVVVLGWALAITAIWELGGWAAHWRLRKLDPRREPIVTTWTSDGLEMRVSTEVRRYRWADLQGWREDADTIAIRTHDKATLIFPKRQIDDPALDELRGYLAAGASLTPPAELPPPMELPDNRHRVTVSEDDFAEAHVAVTRRAAWVSVGFFGLITLALTAGLLAVFGVGRTPPWQLVVPVAVLWPCVIIMAGYGPMSARSGGRRLYQQLHGDGKPFDLGWSEGGIDIAGPLGWEHVGWDTVKSWRETPGVIIVTSRQNGWLAFPKRTLTEAQLADLRAKLGGARTRKGR